MRGSLAPGIGEQPSAVLGTTGPLPARDWQGEAGGSSKAAVSTQGCTAGGTAKSGTGDGSLGLRVMGMGGRHALILQRRKDINVIGR